MGHIFTVKSLSALAVAVAVSATAFAKDDFSANFMPLNSGFNPPPAAIGGPSKLQAPAGQLPPVEVSKKAEPKPAVKTAAKRSAAPAKKNPYDIPDSAMELIPELKERFTLPKLGVTSGASPKLMEQNVIKVGSGRNEVVYVSYRQPNRISTPFTKPRIVDMSGTQFQIINRDIYVAPDKENPIGIFVSGDDAGSQVASLTLIPANIPGQNISLVFEAPQDMPVHLLDAGPAPTHIDMVRSTLLSAVNGIAPDSYEWSALSVGASRIGNVLVKPRKVMSGRTSNVFVYDLENIGSAEIELTEQSFYDKGVQGVVFWPNVKLKAGEKSQAFIMAMKKDN